ncbi:MAG: hypothetical protein FWH19_02375 [Treponema sp.]|nr:hypothetical protein [Treponema sp.]
MRVLFILLFVIFFASPLVAEEEELYEFAEEENGIELSEEPEPFVPDPRWYRSNSLGMPLELFPSRAAAQRYEYSLLVETVDPETLPAALPRLLAPHYEAVYQVELRILYEGSEELSRQWIFRDWRDVIRLSASGTMRFFGYGGDGPRTGSIEFMDVAGLLVRETSYEDDLSEWEYRFSYSQNTLLRTETWYRTPPRSFALVSTDTFRYTRSGSIRSMDRVLHQQAGLRSRVSFPRLGPDLSPIMRINVHSTALLSAFFSDIDFPEGSRIVYNFDSRGRILTELWRASDGRLLGEFQNTWADDRLQTILWRSDDDERLIEFDFDWEGDRIAERNIRRGVLERSVTRQGDRDMEEIYMNGRLVLRAFWEDGLKISEERMSFGGEILQ